MSDVNPFEEFRPPKSANPFAEYAAAPAPSVAADVAKSGGIGVVKGGIGLLGAAGDLSDAGARGLQIASDYLNNKLGIPLYERPSAPSVLNNIPTAASLQKAVESQTGEFYKPKTVAGEYAQTAGEFLPAVIGGPEGIAAKLATRVAVPAVASETAGQLTKGTAAEPYARVAGAMLSPLATMRAATGAAAPTIEELKAAARAGYKSPEVAAVEIHPASVANLAGKIEDDLITQGFRPRNTPGTFDEIRNLSPPQGVASVKVADIDSARKALGVMAKEVDAVGKPTAEAGAAATAIHHINDYLPNISPADVIAGDAPAAAAILKDAGENWGAAKRAESVDVRLTRAERQAAKSGSGSNIENAMRQKVAGMLDVPSRSVGYSAPEVAKMEEIVRGTPARNALRKVGKLGVDGGLSLLLHAGAVAPSGGLSLPVAVGGTIARKVGESLTAGAGRDLSEMVRNRSALARGNQGTSAVSQALFPQAAPQSRALDAVRAALLASHHGQTNEPIPARYPHVVKALLDRSP